MLQVWLKYMMYQTVYVFAMKKTDVYDNHMPTVAQWWQTSVSDLYLYRVPQQQEMLHNENELSPL